MNSELFSVLETMNDGRTLTRIEKQFEELRHAVVDTEGSGELIIRLKVGIGKKNLNPVICTSSVKLPQEAPEKAVFFFDEKDRLVRNDPRQTEMFPTSKVVKMDRQDVPQAADGHNP